VRISLSSLRRRRGAAPTRVLILCYHRIAEPGRDPWRLSVSPQHFAEQLAALARRARPVRLREVAAWLVGDGTTPGPGLSFAVTFDDGYADVLDSGKPVLEVAGVPATAFLISGEIGSNRELWWDELERVLLEPCELPAVLRLQIGSGERVWELGTAVRKAEDGASSWTAESGDDPSGRHALYRELYGLLLPQPAGERRGVLGELGEWAGVPLEARESHRLLTVDESHRLAAGGLVELGCHTRSHALLDQATREAQLAELSGARADLRALGIGVDDVAYPHGRWAPETKAIARAAGFRLACTTVGALVEAGSDRFALPRLVPTDCDGASFERQVLDHVLR
jgi:peptidoglycan/xylan/chitin deacetylase (PgdA/CDA1 family)